MQQFIDYVRGLGAIGYVVYTLGYAIAGLVVPASVLTIGAGALFGFIGGTIVVAIGATLAATIAFFLARTVLRKRVEKWVARNPKFAAVDRAIAREGPKIVVLVRLAAVFPFLFMNYAFGLTGIRPLQYIVATFIGILPGVVAFVSLGAAGAAAATEKMIEKGTRRYLRYFLKEPSETVRPARAYSMPFITLSRASLLSQSQRSSAGISMKGSRMIFPSFCRLTR